MGVREILLDIHALYSNQNEIPSFDQRASH